MLPDGGCTLLHLVQPGGEVLLQQQIIGFPGSSVFTERKTEGRRSHEACHQMPVFLFQQAAQSLHGSVNALRRNQAEHQAENVGRLGLDFHHAAVIQEHPAELVRNSLPQGAVLLRQVQPVQDAARFGEQFRHIGKISGVRQFQRRCAEIAPLFRVQRHPVAELQAEGP